MKLIKFVYKNFILYRGGWNYNYRTPISPMTFPLNERWVSEEFFESINPWAINTADLLVKLFPDKSSLVILPLLSNIDAM